MLRSIRPLRAASLPDRPSPIRDVAADVRPGEALEGGICLPGVVRSSPYQGYRRSLSLWLFSPPASPHVPPIEPRAFSSRGSLPVRWGHGWES